MKFLTFLKLAIVASLIAIMLLLIPALQFKETFKPYPLEDEASDSDFFRLVPYEVSHTLDPPNHPVIHFLEGHGHTTLGRRMWCAVEAACVANPTSSVVLHMKAHRLLWTKEATQLLQEYDNLRIVSLEEQEMFRDSPLKSWYEEKSWERSSWPVSHFNDALRWLIIYHYGGVYMDLDSVSVRPVTPPSFKPVNFAGMESNQWVGAGVVGLNSTHHWLPRVILETIARDFNPAEWGSMGPKLLTRILSKRCGVQMPDRASSTCQDFTILPTVAFHIVPWWRYEAFVNPDRNYSLTHRLLLDPYVLVMHTWNHLTQNIVVPLHHPPTVTYRGDPEVNQKLVRDKIDIPDLENVESSNDRKSFLSPIAMVAKRVCPVTVSLSGEFL